MMIKLKVPYQEKDQAKEAGARWDPAGKFWYLKDPSEHTMKGARKWLPKGVGAFISKNKDLY